VLRRASFSDCTWCPLAGSIKPVDVNPRDASANLASQALEATPFGRYLLLRRLNVGGMAEVHLGKAMGLYGVDRFVAIKRILPGVADDPEFVRMFIDEAKLSVQLTHANIAQTLELGRLGRSFFIAMDYVSGIDVRQVWEHAALGGDLPIAVVLHIMSKLCEGLDYAHRKADEEGRPLGIVHRDISPQNVMLGWDGQLKIIDFGIAKAKVRASRTRVGILKGKFAYMSPEQAAGQELDARSDVFAAGVIFYELLTRTRLFKSESDFATLEKVRHVELFPPRLVHPGIARELENIVLGSLRRDRDSRLPSAEALQQRIMRFAIETGETCGARDLEAFLASSFPNECRNERELLNQVREIPAPEGWDPKDIQSEPLTGRTRIEGDETFAVVSSIFTPDARTRISDGVDDEATKHTAPPSDPESQLPPTRIVQLPARLPEAMGPDASATPRLRKLPGERRMPHERDQALAHRVRDTYGLNESGIGVDSDSTVGQPTKVLNLPTRIVQVPMRDEASKSSAQLKHPQFGRESVLLWSATVFAGGLVLAAFWASSRVNPNAFLALEVEPQQSVIAINGRSTVQDAAANLEVPPGDLVIEVSAPGFCSWSRHVRLAPRERFSIRVALENAPASGCK
jgi:serine/threonine protein kinase